MSLPRESIRHLVEYIIEDEQADYEACFANEGDPEGKHIYTHAVRVNDWLIQEAVDAGEREGEFVGDHTEDISWKYESSPFVFTVPRDDFALLMDTIARCEQGQKLTITEDMVAELSRVASDLSQQADAQ